MSTLQAAERPRAANERRVLHAHLRPATPDGAWALQRTLEDALRCASFDDVGRLVLVRRLRIGALPPRCGSAQLTAAIERAWREVARSAVPALAPGDPGVAREATQATAVWFVSPAAAMLAALARVVDGAAVSAWFWPHAVPLLAVPGGRTERIVALLDDALAAAPTAAAQAFAQWPPARRDMLHAVLSTGAAGHHEMLRPWTAAVQMSGGVAAAAGPQRGPPRADWGASDGRRDRTIGDRTIDAAPPLAAPPSVSPHPGSPLATDSARQEAAPTPPTLQAAPSVRVDGLLPQRRLIARPMPTAGAAGMPAVRSAQRPALDGGPPEPRDSPATPATHALVAHPAPAHAVAPGALSMPPPTRPAAALPWPWLHDARATAHGGILWLLNLLPMVGIGTGSPPALVHAVLAGLMDRAGLCGDDPQRDILPWLPDDAVLPASDGDARRWRARARGMLRRQTGLSLAELACRPAWVTVTPTHADLVLPMTAADLRVRRRGLDRDPGWVPWIGRIVSFHFVAGDDWPEPEMHDG